MTKDKPPGLPTRAQLEDRSWRALKGAVNYVWQQNLVSWCFKEPVDEARHSAPGYYAVIANPQDLGSIRSRLEGGRHYSSPLQVDRDVRQMGNQALLANLIAVRSRSGSVPPPGGAQSADGRTSEPELLLQPFLDLMRARAEAGGGAALLGRRVAAAEAPIVIDDDDDDADVETLNLQAQFAALASQLAADGAGGPAPRSYAVDTQIRQRVAGALLSKSQQDRLAADNCQATRTALMSEVLKTLLDRPDLDAQATARAREWKAKWAASRREPMADAATTAVILAALPSTGAGPDMAAVAAAAGGGGAAAAAATSGLGSGSSPAVPGLPAINPHPGSSTAASAAGMGGYMHHPPYPHHGYMQHPYSQPPYPPPHLHGPAYPYPHPYPSQPPPGHHYPPDGAGHDAQTPKDVVEMCAAINGLMEQVPLPPADARAVRKAMRQLQMADRDKFIGVTYMSLVAAAKAGDDGEIQDILEELREAADSLQRQQDAPKAEANSEAA
eukprot:XP_001690231.1 Ring3 protein [Chlamydomonas reinhardtii]